MRTEPAASHRRGPAGSIGRLTGVVQHYPWGSREVIARLQGRPHPSDEPEAELWFGAHPLAPAGLERADGQLVPLDQAIAACPDQEIGAHRQLPFLVKILAAERPLSIQVHPDATQAAHGYAVEAARGLALDDPGRSYRDPHAKPELVVALSPFVALAGFRPAADSEALVEALGSDAWQRVLAPIRHGGPDGRVEVVAEILAASSGTLRRLIDDVMIAADGSHRSDDGVGGRSEAPADEGIGATADGLADGLADDVAMIAELGRRCPDDPGVPLAMLLKVHRLRPGDALFIEPGCPHAYVRGAAVEVMAPSDNVLRAGLTGKHRDRDGFLAALRAVDGDHTRTRLPFEGPFVVERHELDDATHAAPLGVEAHGPEILVVVDGQLVVADDHRRVEVAAGGAAWIPAAVDGFTLSGRCRLVRVHAG